MRIQRVLGNKIAEPSKQASCLTNFYTAPPLHLLRALLRECSYLPDRNSREFFHEHVVSRFRAYCPRPCSDWRQPFRKTDTIVQRRPDLIRKAQKGLRFLSRANHGHLPHLGKVLAMTYGRIGPRRYDLLKPLKVPDSPESNGALKTVLEQRSGPANQNVPHPSQQLLALLKSQAQRRETTFSRTKLKHSEPRIPETNAWGRPMPIKRVRNMKRRWYAKALDRVMPPLSDNEWEALRKMSCGETPYHGPPARRGPSGEQHSGLEAVKTESKLSRPHDLNSRCMRRLWAKIFQQCPLMKKDPSKPLGWRVFWPDLKTGTEVGLDSAALEGSEMFDGVDESGKVQTAAFD